MKTRTKILLVLAGLCIVDVVLPIPILGLILVYVVLRQPPWFPRAVRECYRKP